MSRYLLDGPGVFVPARVCAVLEGVLGTHLRRLRTEARGRDVPVAEVLSAVRAAGLVWAEQARRDVAGSGSGTFVADDDVGVVKFEASELTTVEVAGLAGCSPRWVARAAEHGDLVGRKRGGQWRFRLEAAGSWIERRSCA